jgi:hypothetical protein
MRDLILEKKTGFSSLLPFVIYETNGTIFYSSDFTSKIANGERLSFNLPAGIYKYDGSFTKLDSPVSTRPIMLPPKERNIAYKRYNIVFGDNPNKCSIFYDTGEILFDNSFRDKPLYIKYGIYFHELGHHWYKTEAKADLFSAYKMLIVGFNPSQIGLVPLTTLSDRPESDDRKGSMAEILAYLTKNEG